MGKQCTRICYVNIRPYPLTGSMRGVLKSPNPFADGTWLVVMDDESMFGCHGRTYHVRSDQFCARADDAQTIRCAEYCK